MTVGSIVHELLQIVLRRRLKTMKEIEEASEELLSDPSIAFTLYASEMGSDDARVEINKFHDKILNFVQEFVGGNKKASDKTVSLSIKEISFNESKPFFYRKIILKGRLITFATSKKIFGFPSLA